MKTKLILSVLVLSFLGACNSEPKHTDGADLTKVDSTKKLPVENPYKNSKLEVKVFNNDSIKTEKTSDVNSKEVAPLLHGFGYEIYMDGSATPYIHQPHIPSINGLKGFNTRAEAYKAGEFVCYKIRNNIMPPGVTNSELDSLGVLK